MTIKLPVAAHGRLVYDADGEQVAVADVPRGQDGTLEGSEEAYARAAAIAAALNATAAPDLRLALENVEAILAEACSSPYDEEWKLISDAWSYVKAILAGETLVETESKTAAEILGLPWDDHDPATEIEAAVSAMGYAEVFGEDGTL